MTTKKATRPASAGVAWPQFLVVGGLHLGALLAFVPAFFSWSGLGVCLLLHWMTGSLGICMTYHRLLTHRSFATRPRWLEYPMTALACCASEGGPIDWVADHRRHHAHSDEEQRRPQPAPGVRLGPPALVDGARPRRAPTRPSITPAGRPTWRGTRSIAG